MTTQIIYDRMSATAVADGGTILPPVVNAPNGPYASGTTPQFDGQIVDGEGAGIPAANLDSLTLSIVDTLTGAVINSVSQVDVLNVGRGTVDAEGNFVITLEAADTEMIEVPSATRVQRSLILDWATDAVVPLVGRHQVNFILLRLAGV